MRFVIDTISTVVRRVIADRRVVVGAGVVSRSPLHLYFAHLAPAYAAAACPGSAAYQAANPGTWERLPGLSRRPAARTSRPWLTAGSGKQAGGFLLGRLLLADLQPWQAMQPGQGKKFRVGGKAMPAAFDRAASCSQS